MPKAYWISAYRNVKDADKLAAYAEACRTRAASARREIFGARHACGHA